MEPGTWRRIERGERALTFETAKQVAEVLACSVDDLITGENVGSEDTSSSQRVVLPEFTTTVDLPVFGIFDLDTSEVTLVRTGVNVARPANVVGNDRAYAMHVFDSAAAPRYDIGDVVVVDPIRPAQPKQWVVAGIRKDTAIVAEIWRLDEIAPVRLSRNGTVASFDRDALASIDLIVGTQLA